MCFRAGFRWMCLKHNVSTSATNSRQLDMRFKHKVSIRFPGANNAASHVESTQSHARSQRPVNVVLHSVNVLLYTNNVLFHLGPVYKERGLPLC